MSALEHHPILELVLRQLSVADLLACSLVSKGWHTCARIVIQRYHLHDFSEQVGDLRYFELNKSTSPYLSQLPNLSNLRSLTIHLPLPASTAESLSSSLSLAFLLPLLPSLAHLYVNGPDSRYRSAPPSMDTKQSFTSEIDRALLSLHRARLQQGRVGLTTLSIASSAEVTWQAIAAYLGIGSSGDITSAADAGLGTDLRSLSLSNCPHLDPALLDKISVECPRLSFLSLRKVDSLFAGDAFPVYPSLTSMSLSTDKSQLPTNYFQAYQHHSRLQHLSITSSKHITSQHISHFSSISRLTISGCPAIGTSLPFDTLSLLREVSYLGQGLTIASIWSLWQHGLVRKITLDSAQIVRLASKLSHPCAASFEGQELPLALQPFASSNVLSPTLPSWVLAYLISLAPASLEAISILSTVEESKFSISTTSPNSTSCPYGWALQEDCQYTPWGLPHLPRQSDVPGVVQRLLSWIRGVKTAAAPPPTRLPILPISLKGRSIVSEGSSLGPSNRDNDAVSSPETDMETAPTSAGALVHDEGFLELLHLPLPQEALASQVGSVSKLTAAQSAWVSKMTGGRIVRLEV